MEDDRGKITPLRVSVERRFGGNSLERDLAREGWMPASVAAG
jgi:hypothetical protein